MFPFVGLIKARFPFLGGDSIIWLCRIGLPYFVGLIVAGFIIGVGYVLWIKPIQQWETQLLGLGLKPHRLLSNSNGSQPACESGDLSQWIHHNGRLIDWKRKGDKVAIRWAGSYLNYRHILKSWPRSRKVVDSVWTRVAATGIRWEVVYRCLD